MTTKSSGGRVNQAVLTDIENRATRAEVPGEAGPPTAVLAPTLRRRPVLLVLAIALIASGGLLGVWLWTLASAGVEVVVVRASVARGEQIEAAHLGVVRVGVDPSLRTVAGAELAGLLGLRARVELSAGALLAPGQVADTVVPGTGESLVAIPLPASLVPAEPMLAGDAVRLVPTKDVSTSPTEQTEPIAARVHRVTGRDTEVVVDILLDSARAPVVAALAASGNITIVLDSRER